jgi:hypothetical protein
MELDTELDDIWFSEGEKEKKDELPSFIKNIKNIVVEPYDYLNKKGISYSQFSIYSECPYRWYLQYIKKEKTLPSINLIFGTAIHETIQEFLKRMFEQSAVAANRWEAEEFFQQRLLELYKEDIEKNKEHYSTPDELKEFVIDGLEIIEYFKKNRNNFFTKNSQILLGIELPINVYPTENPNVFFNGKIDLVIYDTYLNKVKIIDIKTSTMGWNKYQKTDKIKLRQLPLYKKFFNEQYQVPMENIDIEYFIVKRKIYENAEYSSMKRRIQIFSPPGGKTTINQVTTDLEEFVKTCFDENGYRENVEYFKDSSSCKWCPFKDRPDLCDKGAFS